MKARLIHIFLVFCLVSVFSCNKENEPQNEWPSDGKASFKINGIVMNTELRALIRDTNFSIALENYRIVEGSLSPWEALSISEIRKETNLFQRILKRDTIASIYPNKARNVGAYFGTPQADGDVTCDSYYVIEQDSVNNWIVIDKQLDNFSEVWGSFSLHLFRTRSCSSSIYLDTLLITDGKFHFSL